MNIFLSYRQADAVQAFREILKRLIREFGAENVFHDTDVRNTGKPFPPNLTAKIQEADAVIAVIGQHWLREGSNSGKTDWVVKEIETALESSGQIYPLLVENATFPKPLPASIARFGEFPSAELRPDRFQGDLEAFIRHIHVRPKLKDLTLAGLEQITLIESKRVHTGAVTDVICATGELVNSAGEDGTVAWIKNGRVTKRTGEEKPILAMTLAMTTQELSVLSPASLRVWPKGSSRGEEIFPFDPVQEADVFAIHPYESWIACSGKNLEVLVEPVPLDAGKAFTLPRRSPRTFWNLLPVPLSAVSLAIDQSGKLLVAGLENGMVALFDGTSLDFLWARHPAKTLVTGVAFEPTMQTPISGFAGGICIHADKDRIARIEGVPLQLAISADGTLIASVQDDGAICVVDLDSLTSKRLKGPLNATAVSFSPDNDKLCVGTKQGEVQTWGVASRMIS